MLNSSPGASRRRRTVLYASAASAAVAASLSAVLLSAGSSGATVTQGSPIAAAVIPALRANMLQLARFNGDAHPVSVSAVLTTRARALRLVAPANTVPGSARQRVYLVVLTGNFTDTRAPVPPGAKDPSGRYLAVTVNPATWQVMDLSIGNHRPAVPLSSLGAVSALVR
jgi:hypothetical protein